MRSMLSRALGALDNLTDPKHGATPLAIHRVIVRLARQLTFAIMVLALAASAFSATIAGWLIVALGAVELAFIQLQEYIMRGGRLPRWLVPAHISFSLLLLTAGVTYSGGIQSSFVWVYGLSMAVEGVLRGRRWALASATISVVYLFLATAVVRMGIVDYPRALWSLQTTEAFFISYTGMFFTVAITTSILGERLRSQYGEISGLAEQLRESYLGTVRALGSAVDVKDTYTGQHAGRVERRAIAVARALGVSEMEIEQMRFASILHDIGKIGVPEHILRKPGPLTRDEWALMRQHVVAGAAILEEVPFLRDVAGIVRHHHERLDGGGYPDGLSGEAIPLGSRIIAVVDAYEAMTTDRPYRRALGHAHAVKELRAHAVAQFDPRVVEVFLGLSEAERLGAAAAAPGREVSALTPL